MEGNRLCMISSEHKNVKEHVMVVLLFLLPWMKRSCSAMYGNFDTNLLYCVPKRLEIPWCMLVRLVMHVWMVVSECTG